MQGVYHSPLGEGRLPGMEKAPWYGSSSVLPLWAHHIDGSEPAAGGAAAVSLAAAGTVASGVAVMLDASGDFIRAESLGV